MERLLMKVEQTMSFAKSVPNPIQGEPGLSCV